MSPSREGAGPERRQRCHWAGTAREKGTRLGSSVTVMAPDLPAPLALLSDLLL